MMIYDNQIKALESEMSLINERLDRGNATVSQLGKHVLLAEQLRQLRWLRLRQEHDLSEIHDEYDGQYS
jgi:hypothetical protein